MQVLQHLRPRLILCSRVIMWVVVGLFVMVGIFGKSEAWAETAACPGQSSIPITPITLFLRYGGPPSTYQVSLCEDPDPGTQVEITTTVSLAGKVTITPTNFALTSTIPLTVSVGVTAGHPISEPFTVIITHSATSNDPDFDWGTLNVPQVTAYYSPPVAITDTVATVHGQSINISVLTNDFDRLGQGLSLPASAIVSAPANGSASRTITQTILYTPTAGFAGTDSFTYRVQDAIGNTDVGTVIVTVAPANVQNPQVEVVDTSQGGEVVFGVSFGDVTIDVPPLIGFPPGSEVVFTFGEIITPTGNIDAPPGNIGTFSGISFYLVGTVNGVPIDAANLSEPLMVSISLPEGVVQELDGARLIIARWNGTSWSTEGITIEDVVETTSPNLPDDSVIRFTTSVFGEFAIFVVRDLFLPSLDRTQ